MTLSEYLIEAVAKRSTGKYSFSTGDMSITGLKSMLNEMGYTEKPSISAGIKYNGERVRGLYIGQNCYFMYRDHFSLEIVVSSENDTEHSLAFNIGPYDTIDYLFVIETNGRCLGGPDNALDAKKNKDEVIRVVRKFLGIK